MTIDNVQLIRIVYPYMYSTIIDLVYGMTKYRASNVGSRYVMFIYSLVSLR